MLDLIKGEVPVGLCSWSKGSGAFASNLVMLKGNWYWVNNAHNTHSLLSVFTHLYVVFFFIDRWHNSCWIWKIYFKKAFAHLLGKTHIQSHSRINMFNKLYASTELHENFPIFKLLKRCTHAYNKFNIQTRLKNWSHRLIWKCITGTQAAHLHSADHSLIQSRGFFSICFPFGMHHAAQKDLLFWLQRAYLSLGLGINRSWQ